MFVLPGPLVKWFNTYAFHAYIHGFKSRTGHQLESKVRSLGLFLMLGSGKMKTYIAHRGLYSDVIPENSISAFTAAIKQKMPIELDLQITKDNQIVVFHDKNLKRMTGVDKNLSKCTYAEISNLKLGNSTENIPLFKDVLKLVNGKVFLDIEIKHYGRMRKIVKLVSELMHNYQGDYTIKSFNPLIPYYYKKKNPQCNCGVLVGNITKPKFVKNILLNLNYLIVYKPDFVAYNIKEINEDIIRKLNKYNIPLHLFTINNWEDFQKYSKLSDTLIIENINLKRLER